MRKLGSIVNITSSERDSTCNVSQINRVAKRGAIWVTITSAAAIPLGYYRNWILGQFGSNGDVVGQFALIVLFIQIVNTFVLYGGTTVTTNYLPKIRCEKDKTAFIFTYSIFCLSLSIGFIVLLHFFPALLIFLLNKPINSIMVDLFSIATPIIVFSQLINFALVGLSEFRISSLLNQLQLVLVCFISTIYFFFFRNFFIDNALSILIATVCCSCVVVILFGFFYIFKKLPSFSYRFFFPLGFWGFSIFVQLNTVMSFFYVSIDQLFILSFLGVKELGAYFVLMQCAQFIRFVPDRIGQVMLSSFSQLIVNDNIESLQKAYEKLCRLILILTTPLSLLMIIFSQQIASVFGDWYGERHIYLRILATTIGICSLGGVNSMLIMSKERTGLFLTNSTVQITLQFLVTLLFIKNYGVYAAIAGKALGLVFAQIGLFYIIRLKLEDINLSIPWEFWVSTLIIIFAAIITSFTGDIKLINSLSLYIFLVMVFYLIIKLRYNEVINIFQR